MNTKTKIDVIVTQHAPLLRYLRELGLADDTTVIEHAEISDIAGKHVAGVLPVAMAAKCASYTEVPMSMTTGDRLALRQGDLSYDRMREIAGEPRTYFISTDRAWPVSRCFDAAVRFVVMQGCFHVSGYAQGTLEFVSEGGDYLRSQIDLYRDRYRTRGMGHRDGWSPWLDENGALHRDQSDPCALGRYVWLKECTAVLEDAKVGDLVEIWATGDFLSDAPERYSMLGHETSDTRGPQARLRPIGARGLGRDRLLPTATPAKIVTE